MIPYLPEVIKIYSSILLDEMISTIFEDDCLMKNCYIGLGPIKSSLFRVFCERMFIFSEGSLKGPMRNFNFAAIGWNKYACYIYFQLNKEVEANQVMMYLGFTGESEFNIISIYDPSDNMIEGSLHVIEMDEYCIAGSCK